MLVALFGVQWLYDPTWLPALGVGIITVLVPFFIMQPAMGAGIAGARTATPGLNRLRSVLTHGVFGCGLTLSAMLLNVIWQ